MHMLCTICSDLVNQVESIYVTKCGHIFHYHCLAQWIERSKTCPQCRNKVNDKCMFRLYPTISNDVSISEDATTLQSQLDDAKLQLRQEKTVSKEKDDRLSKLQSELESYEQIVKAHEVKLISNKAAMNVLRDQIDYLKIQNKETVTLKEENESLKKHLQLLDGLNKVLNGSYNDVEEMVRSYSDVHTLATFATSLKRGLCESEAKWKDAMTKLNAAKQQISADNSTVANLQTQLSNIERKLLIMKKKYSSLVKRKAENMSGNEGSSLVGSGSQPGPKQMRTSDICVENNTSANDSINTMLNRIETAESPYFNLRQGNIAHSALLRNVVDKIKPSELAIINSERNAVKKHNENIPVNGQKNLSIFKKKEPVSLDLEAEKNPALLDISYDGLGGHSKLDQFPIPNKATVKSFIPKRSAKHRLQRPPQAGGSLDIGEMLQKLRKCDK